ncbi:YbaB/EbfC family nucleoid-associated protein [Nocardia sp. NPDC050406]|uniref:YbaB/EbfC family nucleoid-associated protein n=1 Tax=Nocardia sp. NPDC050406 TaxID=3364318 RepID=UPI003794C9CF
MSADAEAALTELMRQAARIEEEVARVRGHGEAAQGAVRAEVDATGVLVGLYIAETLQGVAVQDIGRMVVHAQRVACEQARGSVTELRRVLTENPYAAALFHRAAAEGMR